MKKSRLKTDLMGMARIIDQLGGTVSYVMAQNTFGPKLLKKGRRQGIIAMDPDPHDGRTSRRVGQQVTRRLSGYMKNAKRSKKETVTSIRRGKNVTPTRAMLTDAGREMLKKNNAVT